jgi:hypothetical protein
VFDAPARSMPTRNAGPEMRRCVPVPAEPDPDRPRPDRVLPPKRLPLWYLGLAHLSLGAAFALVMRDPLPVLASPAAPHTLAVVHLVTLGCITMAILGASLVVLPLVLKAPYRAGRIDAFACAGFVAGTSGVIAQFWIGEFSGIAWSAGLIAAAVGAVAVRAVRSLRAASAPLPVRVALALAWLHLLLATVLGAGIAISRSGGFAIEQHTTVVFAHAHLAVVGFAVLMAIGTGHRLVPMLLPAAPADARRLWFTIAALELGLIGLVVGLLGAPPLVPWSAALVAVAILSFVIDVAAMLRRLRPPPKGRERRDPAVVLVLAAVGWVAVATALGLWLALSSERSPRAMTAYGIAGLVGGLAQLVVGVAMRLAPMHLWIARWAGGGYATLPQPAVATGSRAARALAALAWLTGVPLCLLAVVASRPSWLATGALVLLLGTCFALWNAAVATFASRRRHGSADA